MRKSYRPSLKYMSVFHGRFSENSNSPSAVTLPLTSSPSAVSFLAFKEYISMIPTRRSDRQVVFWAYLSIPLQYYWICKGWYWLFIIFI
ncbi:MAG: hypothetical protein JSU99_03205, partial [Nitrospiraceae bacterium]